ncbi:MAG: accessory Sec system protein Asp1 [Lachnospiraceae bacterium]|nr:accessory Sec system protein Asp1 [Lachnospiraceae bacterium]
MIFFIPAWYKADSFHENEQKWYARRLRTEFDDTVKQVQLFNRKAAYPYSILLPAYAPNFRHFLHRQGVFHAPYISVFDSIQHVRLRQIYVLSFHNLKWPENIEFVYTNFVIMGYVNKRKYAQIEFGEDGNPIQVDIFDGEKLKRSNIYDDRGFVSSTILYEDGKPYTQEYLTPEGVWKLRLFYSDSHVEVNPEKNTYLIMYDGKEKECAFKSLRYRSILPVIEEVLEAYIKMTDYEDIFCIAVHDRNIEFLRDILRRKKTVLSFFEDRVNINDTLKLSPIVNRAGFVIADSKTSTARLRILYKSIRNKITDITPYDSRVDFGISGQLNVQKILFPIDGLEDRIFDDAVRYLAQYMDKNRSAEVHFLTRLADYDLEEKVKKKVRRSLENTDEQMMPADEGAFYTEAENELIEEDEDEDGNHVRFFFEQCVDELSVSRCMRTQRVMVDLRKVPDLYLQISCISMGIPQIVRTETEYVEHMKNGQVINHTSDLPRVLDFYLDGLANWNEALIHSYEIGKQYTTENILERWRKVIETFE